MKKYGYDGKKYPNKHFIITESNIPAKEFDEFMGSYEAQRNYLMKCLVKSQVNGVLQFHVYSVAQLKEYDSAHNEFDLMGLYSPLENTPNNKVRIQESGIAYATTSNILRGYRYDSLETKMLNLPPEADGAAFKNEEKGDFIYCLWAKTYIDRSEETEVNYTFPAKLNMTQTQMRSWDYSQTFHAQILSTPSVKLTGTPAFFQKGQLELKEMPKNEAFYGFQNPVEKSFFINYRLEKSDIANLKIYDVNNRKYTQLFDNQTIDAGLHQWRINTEGYVKGIYIVQLGIGRQVFLKKFYVSK